MAAILTRQRQFGGKKEGTEGTAETLVAADFAINAKAIDAPALGVPAYERELMRGSLSKDVALKAVRSMIAKATIELAGGAAATAAAWHDLLEACGFAKTQLKVVDIGTITDGPFVPGDIVGDNATFASATKTGILICVVDASPDKAVYLPLTGTFAATDTMYNYATPQVSAPVDSIPANAGWGFRLVSETAAVTPASATIEVRDGQQIFRIVGGRGKVNFNLAHNAPVLMEFEFQGPLIAPSDTIPTGSFMTGITAIAYTPVMGKSFPILFDAFSPILTQLTISVDNTLTLRPNLNTGTIGESGYLATRITDRKINVTADPEHPAVGSKSFLNEALAGTTDRMYVQAGPLTAGAAAGTAIFIGPKLQIVEDPAMGDRDGIVIDNLSMMLAWSGLNENDELVVAHVFI